MFPHPPSFSASFGTHLNATWYQKALALHQAGKNNVEKNLAELGEKLGSIPGIRAELVSCAALLNNDRPGKSVEF